MCMLYNYIYIYIYNYIYIPSMYKSLKVKLSTCTNTPHGFDKKSRYKVSITIADSSCEAWWCCQKQTRQWIDPLLMTPEDDVICDHHVLGYDQWYTRLMLSNLTLYQPGLPAGEMYMQLWDNAEQHMSYIIIYCHTKKVQIQGLARAPPPCIWTFLPVWCVCARTRLLRLTPQSLHL